MRNFLIISFITLILTNTIARPSQMEERNESEAEQNEYESNEEALDENTQDDDESRLSDQDASDMSADDGVRTQQLVKMSRQGYMHRPVATDAERDARAGSDNFSEYSGGKGKDETQSNEYPPMPQRRQSNRYIDNSDVNDPPENLHLTNYKTNRFQETARNDELTKRTLDTHLSFDDNEALYENDRGSRRDGDKVEFNNDAVDPNEQRRLFKQYYNTMQPERKSRLGDRNYEMANRDRRQAEPIESISSYSSSTEKNSFADISNQDDEAAIKRHIRKLSGEELEELLNSLSDDKKALLNKIMDGDRTYESISKREITKKAGAVDENGLIDSSLSEISKVQGGPSIDVNTDSALSPSTDLENSKQPEIQTEIADLANSKTSETTRTENNDSKIDLTRQANDPSSNVKSSNAFDQSSDSPNSQSIRTENKRETNINEITNVDGPFNDEQILEDYGNAKDSEYSFNDQGHICSDDNDLAQLMDEEALLHNSNEREYKREVQTNQVDLDDSIKSLEDSFPNSNSDENGQYLETNMAPLVRVKRTDDDSVINKRAVVDASDDKVAYVPFKGENDDEDNEEGSEFDDDGFYDRTSNYAKSDANKPADKFVVRSSEPKMYKSRNSNEESKSDESPNEKIDSDSTSLGSDTDSVLSGIEGVDDNLMLNSGVRQRRTVEKDSEQSAEIDQNRPVRSTPVLLDETKPSATYINLPNYQETEAFGPLPRDEGELSRYKRIRRVKPSQTAEVPGAGK